MSITSVSSATNPYQTNSTQNAFRQEFQALQQALQSGDLTSAQQAFAALQKDNPRFAQAMAGGSSTGQSNPASSAFQSLASALQSGDLKSAQSAFTSLTQRVGRKKAFLAGFLAAMGITAFTFWKLSTFTDIFWMIPLMGFAQLSLFGGYAIYLPELFPTRLRSTGTSFCYNIGRFVAALGPLALGLLTSRVYAGYDEPMRYAGVTMCAAFLIGILALPFAPETKGKPLPE